MFTYRTLKQTIHDALVGAAVAGGAQAVNLLTHDDFTPTSWEHVLVLAVGGIAGVVFKAFAAARNTGTDDGEGS